MIAITGATGQLGRLVISSLLKKTPAANIIAAVRNAHKAKDLAAKGVQVRIADYNQPQAWDGALKGAEKVLLISASDVGQRARQHRSVIDAAKRTGVELLAYTSVLRADTSVLGIAAEHRETEAAIRASGLPSVLLRNGWYTENYLAGIPAALSMGAVYGCAGQGRISSASRADFAEAAAAVLTGDGQAGRGYELAGDAAYTLADLAAELTHQAGREIKYVNVSEAEYRGMLVKVGFPAMVAGFLADAETGISKGALFDESRQLSRMIGRPTTPLAVSVTAALKTA